MKHDVRLVVVAATICLALSVGRLAPARAQTPATVTADATLVVAGDVTQPLTIKAADLKAMPRTTVTVTEEGRQTSSEGVLVGELLKRRGALEDCAQVRAAGLFFVASSSTDRYEVF